MSGGKRRTGQIGEDEWVQPPHHIALQVAANFLAGHTFLRPALDVSPGPGIASHADHCDGPQGIVCRPVAAPVQAMPDRLAGRHLRRTCAAKCSQRSFTFEAFGIVSRHSSQYRSGLRADAESFAKASGMLAGQTFKHAIESFELLRQRQPPLRQQTQRGRERLQDWRLAQRTKTGTSGCRSLMLRNPDRATVAVGDFWLITLDETENGEFE
jgi:hypothetical protein